MSLRASPGDHVICTGKVTRKFAEAAKGKVAEVDQGKVAEADQEDKTFTSGSLVAARGLAGARLARRIAGGTSPPASTPGRVYQTGGIDRPAGLA